MEFNINRTQQHIRNFERCISLYEQHEPFARFLTTFYKTNKQMGSSDRRMNNRLCYNFFRIGKAFSSLNHVERLVIAEFLCSTASAVVALHKPEWLDVMESAIEDKILVIESNYGPFMEDVFPGVRHLSDQLDKVPFISSHFIQPNLFIRVQKDKVAAVINEFTKQGIDFEQIGSTTFSLSNGTKLQDLNKINGYYEVQDLSSQQTSEFIPIEAKQSWWDCCAASGGKSLMILDKEPNIKLMVSDIRPSILRNLDERFEQAAVKTYYRKKILDLSQAVDHIMQGERFDGILLDAPCTGSGTWGRTPESLSSFDVNSIIKFQDLQKKIALNSTTYLRSGKSLIYITCSVFKEENEQVVDYIINELGFELMSMNYLKGYQQCADSMFIARLQKP
ncbi:RsmB/NOP family class I SAM-dependent RNA methyltransferase [Sphingobacterium sp. HJSM2_6]|uniref:RsmB/NOP family class I SAM-dependent RNA methyltransferase n=1 Tax=Sphingobacterium sp. HJSM2_6 TaxID=3366264 RepID=UPI003BD0CA0F